MDTVKKLKRCGVCRKHYTGVGRRVVVGTSFRRACPTCAATAVRVAQSMTILNCACGNAASQCDACLARAVQASRVELLGSLVQAMKVRLTAFKKAATAAKGQENLKAVIRGFEEAIKTLLDGPIG
jgi:hypothetical protein